MAACAELQAAVPDAATLDVVVASAPGKYILYAGQHEEVGDVSVTNDNEYVCVTYTLNPSALTDGWLIHETHLFIGTEASSIPQNRQGNPVPGKFPYGEVDLGGVVSWDRCVAREDLGAAGTLVIAAQAAIEQHEAFVPTLTWTRSSELDVKGSPGYGAQWDPAEGFAMETDPAQIVWDRGTIFAPTGSGPFPSISYASWLHRSGPGNVDLRRFKATFELPTGSQIFGATIASATAGHEDKIPINDNIYVFLNQQLQFWGGTIVGEPKATYPKVFLGMPGVGVNRSTVHDLGTHGWFIWRSQLPPISPSAFEAGSNVLDVFAEEFEQWGGMHELALTLDVSVATESAWGDGDLISASGNWGTYFEYVLQDATFGTP